MKFDKFTLKAQEALATAQQLAMAKSHTVTSPLHLLGAVCGEDSGIAVEILKKIGANVPRIREMTESELGRRAAAVISLCRTRLLARLFWTPKTGLMRWATNT